MNVLYDDARRKEQDQFEHRMVQHVQQAAADGDRVPAARHGTHNARSGQDKADLGDRGACQHMLDVNGEQRAHRTDKHRDHT